MELQNDLLHITNSLEIPGFESPRKLQSVLESPEILNVNALF